MQGEELERPGCNRDPGQRIEPFLSERCTVNRSRTAVLAYWSCLFADTCIVIGVALFKATANGIESHLSSFIHSMDPGAKFRSTRYHRLYPSAAHHLPLSFIYSSIVEIALPLCISIKMKVDTPPLADEKGLIDDKGESLAFSENLVPKSDKKSNVKKALAGVLLFLSVAYFTSGLGSGRPRHPHRHSELHVEGEGELAPYWSGVIDKGLRLAVKQGRCHSHEEGIAKHGKHHDHDHKHHKGKHGDHHHGDHHDDHDHDKHSKHGKHGKDGKHGKHHDHPPPPFIPPRMAEKLFLEVPNNDSVRA